MKQFIAFTKKELYESAATYRLYILLTVFLILGVMGPLMAMLMPTIMEALMAAEDSIIIILPEPTAFDAWTQFFSGILEMGIPVLVIIFCGIMSNEFSKGTLVNLLTKGLKRHTVILSKFLTAGALWLVAYVLAVAVAYAYTAFYWETDAINHAGIVFFSPWLYGLLFLAVLVLGGTLFGNFYGSLFSAIGLFAVMIAISFVPGASRFNPQTLTGVMPLMQGNAEAADFIPTIGITAGLIVLFIIGTIIIFNHKKV